MIAELPAVSVVMSVHNGQKYLRDAVESILNQTFRNFEFIIIDDGSTDNSKEILEEYAAKDSRIRFVSRENRGFTKSLNEGLALARGKYIARMDADDIAFPQRFENQVRFLEEHSETVVLGCNVELIDEDGDKLGLWTRPVTHQALEEAHLQGIGGSLVHPTVMLRAAAVQVTGGYREDLFTTQDFDLFLRLGEVGRLGNLPDVLLQYRMHLESVGFKKLEEQYKTLCEILKEAHVRRGLKLQRLPDRPYYARESREESLVELASFAERSGNMRVAKKHAGRALRTMSVKHVAWPQLVGIVYGRLAGIAAKLFFRLRRRIF